MAKTMSEMRSFFTARFRGGASQAGDRRRGCQQVLLVVGVLCLGACGKTTNIGIYGSVEGFAGAAVADEPRAAVIARDVLSANGSAADAAVAMFFTLAVTLPSSAGLGGGGVCVIHDPENKRTEALEFLPRAAPDGRVALPGNVRGMAALHARYGRLRWEQLLAPAENLATLGTPASRALAREVATAGDKLLTDPEVARVFARADGRLIDEGDQLRQPELATVLGQIRQKGAGEFYTGTTARNLSAGALSIGAPLTMDAMRGVLPEFRDPVQVEFGYHYLSFAPPPAAGGLVAAQLFALLSAGRDWESASDDERPHLFVEASKRAFAERTRWMQPDGSTTEVLADLVSSQHVEQLMANYDKDHATAASTLDPVPIGRPENPWATSFVAVDRDGFAVACNVTMNALFGSGRMAPGTGVFLAPAPDDSGTGAVSLGPMILANKPTGDFYYAAAASGGPTAATAMIAVFLRAAAAEESLESAIAAKRLHHNGDPDLVFFEQGESQSILDDLTRRGHQLEEAGIIGRVNAVWCPKALPGGSASCQVQSDPRANGLANILSEE